MPKDNYSVPVFLRVAWNAATEEMLSEALRPLMAAVQHALIDLELPLSIKTGKPKRQTQDAIRAAKNLRAALTRANQYAQRAKGEDDAGSNF